MIYVSRKGGKGEHSCRCRCRSFLHACDEVYAPHAVAECATTLSHRRSQVCDTSAQFLCTRPQVQRIGTRISAMIVEGIGPHVEDMLVFLVLSIIISQTFRILTHEENQYSYAYKILGHFLSKVLKQTKAGPRSSELLF